MDRRLFIFVTLLLSANPSAAQNLLFGKTNHPSTQPSHRLAWRTEKDINYRLETSNDLERWRVVGGFPRKSETVADQHLLNLDQGKAFFRLIVIDEQPPAISEISPPPDALGLPSNASISVRLSDASPIQPNSVKLTIGNGPVIDISSPQLQFVDDVIQYNPGSAGLGLPGDTISVKINASDALGNALEFSWSFTLHLPPSIPANIFVFGSNEAHDLGQSSKAIEREWEIEEVKTDTITIRYKNIKPDCFVRNMLICNSTPRSIPEFFYRKIDYVIDDNVSKKITLETEDAELGDFINQGSVSLNESFSELNFDTEDSSLAKDSAAVFTRTLPTLGGAYDGETIFSSAGISLTLGDGKIVSNQTISGFLEIKNGDITNFDAKLSGVIDAALNCDLVAAAQLSRYGKRELYNFSKPYIAFIGYVPVLITVKGNIEAFGFGSTSGSASIGGGFSQTTDFSLGCNYMKDRTPALEASADVDPSSVSRRDLEYNVIGNAAGEVGFVGKFTVTVAGAAGFEATIDPRFGFGGYSNSDPDVGRRSSWELYARANLNMNFFIKGVKTWNLYETQIYNSTWNICEPSYPNKIVLSPVKKLCREGESVTISVKSCYPKNTTFQWFHNGTLIPGVEGATFTIRRLNESSDGNYSVKALINGASLESNVSNIVIDGYDVTYEVMESTDEPSIMVQIPVGDEVETATLFSEGSEVGTLTRQIESWKFNGTEGTVEMIVRSEDEEEEEGDEVEVYRGSYNPTSGSFSLSKSNPKEIVLEFELDNGEFVTYYSEGHDSLTGVYNKLKDTISGNFNWSVTTTWSIDESSVTSTVRETFFGK